MHVGDHVARLAHGLAGRDRVGEAQLAGGALHLGAEQPALPAPAGGDSRHGGHVLGRARHDGVEPVHPDRRRGLGRARLGGGGGAARQRVPGGGGGDVRAGRALGPDGEAEPGAANLVEAGGAEAGQEGARRVRVVAERLQGEAELDRLGVAERAGVDDVGVEHAELEVAAGLEHAHALPEAGVPLVDAVLAEQLEHRVQLPRRDQVELVVGKGELGEALDGDLPVVGWSADVAVAELPDRLGGDGVDLGVGVLQGRVPRPVAGPLPGQVEDARAVAADAVGARGHAALASEALRHRGRDEAAAVQQLDGGDLPGSHAHLGECLGLLVRAEPLRVVDRLVISANDVCAHALLGRLRDHRQLELAKQLVAVGIPERDALGLEGLEARMAVDEDVLGTGPDNSVGKGTIVGRLPAQELWGQVAGNVLLAYDVGKADSLLPGLGLFRLSQVVLRWHFWLVFNLLQLMLRRLCGIVLLREAHNTLHISPLRRQPHLCAIHMGHRMLLLLRSVLRITFGDDLGNIDRRGRFVSCRFSAVILVQLGRRGHPAGGDRGRLDPNRSRGILRVLNRGQLNDALNDGGRHIVEM